MKAFGMLTAHMGLLGLCSEESLSADLTPVSAQTSRHTESEWHPRRWNWIALVPHVIRTMAETASVAESAAPALLPIPAVSAVHVHGFGGGGHRFRGVHCLLPTSAITTLSGLARLQLSTEARLPAEIDLLR